MGDIFVYKWGNGILAGLCNLTKAALIFGCRIGIWAQVSQTLKITCLSSASKNDEENANHLNLMETAYMEPNIFLQNRLWAYNHRLFTCMSNNKMIQINGLLRKKCKLWLIKKSLTIEISVDWLVLGKDMWCCCDILAENVTAVSQAHGG